MVKKKTKAIDYSKTENLIELYLAKAIGENVTLPATDDERILVYLRKLIEVIEQGAHPEIPSEDGDYILQRKNGINTYGSLSTWLSANDYHKMQDLSSDVVLHTTNALTVTYKKAIKTGNVVNFTIVATNNSGAEIAANAQLFDFGTILCPPTNIEFPYFRYGSTSIMTLSQFGGMWSRTAIANGSQIVITGSYITQ